MPEVAFDTHAEIRKLEEAGCPTAQAEAMVDLVSRSPLNIQMVKALERLAFQVETNMATKTDIARLEGEIAGVRAEGKTDTEGLRGAVKRNIEGLRGEVKRNIEGLRGEVKRNIEGLRAEGKAEITALRGEVKADIAGLRADMFRALWIQGGALAALILALAGMMLGFGASLLSGA